MVIEVISGDRYRDICQKGWKALLEASNTVSASVTAQGAHMARSFQKMGESDPVSIGYVLLAKPGIEEKIVQAAHAAHKRRGVENRIPLDKLKESAAKVALESFKIAGALITLDDATLVYIYQGLFPQIGHSKNDVAMMTAVKNHTGIDILQLTTA